MGPEVILGILSLAVSGAEFGLNLNDRFRNAFRSKEDLNLRQSRVELERILDLAPKKILDSFFRRVNRCFNYYDEVISNDEEYLPGEIDDATEAVINCVCRELKRLHRVNGGIPSGVLKKYWEKYQCRVD